MDARLAFRRRVRWAAIALVLLIATVALLDHAGAFGYGGDDRANFDRKPARAIQVIDGDSFIARCENRVTTVRLQGVVASAGNWAKESKAYLAARLKDRTFTLRLDGTETRDGQGRLMAYVYITDSDCLNVDIARDGQAFADRRSRNTLHTLIETAENDARKKKRGLWKDLKDEDMPMWRREWLRSLQRR